MQNVLVKDGNLFVSPSSAQKAEVIVEKIQNLVKKANVNETTINLCGLNMFEALKVASLTGVYGLINNLNNRYEIIVDDVVTMSQIQTLSLSNVKVRINEVVEKIKAEKELVVVV